MGTVFGAIVGPFVGFLVVGASVGTIVLGGVVGLLVGLDVGIFIGLPVFGPAGAIRDGDWVGGRTGAVDGMFWSESVCAVGSLVLLVGLCVLPGVRGLSTVGARVGAAKDGIRAESVSGDCVGTTVTKSKAFGDVVTSMTLVWTGYNDPIAFASSSPFRAFPITSIRLTLDCSSFKYKSRTST